MPYESFKCSHQLSIRGLVQDRRTGSWRYLIQVRRVIHDSDAAPSSELQPSSPAAPAIAPTKLSHWHRSGSFSSYATASPTGSSSAATFGPSQVYNIRRSFAEFKLLHAAMKLLMAPSALPSLPVDSILVFFVGETQTMLQKKRLALENLLIAIESHSAASDSTEYLEFLARTDTYEQVSRAPASPRTPAAVPQRYGSDNSQRRGRRRRRQSIEGKFTTASSAGAHDTLAPATHEASPGAQETRVDFHRYSMV